MHRRSFTLLEVMLSIGLLLLMMAMVLPNLGGVWKRRSLVESADSVRSLIVMARARAMLDGIRYRIAFPGSPDPNDPFAEDEIDIPLETQQPFVERQADPLNNPEQWETFEADWLETSILQEGTRCVAVIPGRPGFEVDPQHEISGPGAFSAEDTVPFHRVTFNPDGTCDWATFVLTDLPPDTELEELDVGRIVNVIVDGRTGEAWLQRAMRTEEVELMQEYGAEPILHMDFTSTDMITEDNILEVHQSLQGATGSGAARRP